MTLRTSTCERQTQLTASKEIDGLKDLSGLAFYEGKDGRNPAGTDRQRLAGLRADFGIAGIDFLGKDGKLIVRTVGQTFRGLDRMLISFKAGRFELASETSAINE